MRPLLPSAILLYIIKDGGATCDSMHALLAAIAALHSTEHALRCQDDAAIIVAYFPLRASPRRVIFLTLYCPFYVT